MIETEGVRSAGFNEGDFRKWIESTASLGRIGQPDDIAPTAVYLASADSKYLTGETVRVTGGLLLNFYDGARRDRGALRAESYRVDTRAQDVSTLSGRAALLAFCPPELRR